MEMIQDYAQLLTQFLPPSLLNPLITFVSTAFALFKTLQSHLSPLLVRITTQPDFASILMLVAILFVSFKVLGMAYRAVMFWVTLVLRLAFWATCGFVAVWVYNRGIDGFVDDMQGLAEYWSAEYDKYSGEVKRFQGQQETKIRSQTGKGRGRGRGGW
ncbi:hypothetical protein K505DRAFT_353674 [Melanomma pulvis-pyrius CBS 109.77]|uniref:Nuclear pore assembly and biogenesis-domain-containing protein n=1 Tax=Melanomma pulvis-pyrius CBS 109.77 TaxID=1314802 RepID=A0A6A6WVC3_9PLEO|nr:hypothetical protein K505DRAFT_353674 [Melanomma pulvis-pyrius CBS 109.77]